MTTDITELAQRARINAECGEHLSPAETIELVEALEKAQTKAIEQGRTACELFDEVTALRQRIAELESRTVKLPDGYVMVPVEPNGDMLAAAQDAYGETEGDIASTLRAAIAAAPQEVKGE